MEDKQLTKDYLRTTKDYLRNDLQDEIRRTRDFFTSCTMSTIRWLQRYSHCYSIVCSFFCLPLWILILPIAFVFDICIYTITLMTFIIAFIIYFLCAPCMLLNKFSSCSDACNPINIYRYSMRQAIAFAVTVFACFDCMWTGYCGSGDEYGAPICCIYCCCTECRDACSQATHIEMHDRPCTIL